MKILFFSSDSDLIDEWQDKCISDDYSDVYDVQMLEESLVEFKDCVVIVDYDSMASELNKLIAGNRLPQKVIVLETVPEVLTGKMLISHGVKAYANSRILPIHYTTMLEVVERGDIWTYPELTAALVKQEKSLSVEALELLEHRLTEQEKKVVMAILNGLTNDAIAHKFGITIRTVKSHVSSIFSKLHVNDRVALILLLK
ncbi:response regulator transcription factor [Sulfurimonas sp. SAG-AH-194-C21]|nr:LuxR C-terminal-related transcriptional regulator [Sulfurimonas sp. SAG-AH-194-C21]MDF1884040.1 response regulator transcription factor [Sulfurimonas sp. SAG-AH-194-C21]